MMVTAGSNGGARSLSFIMLLLLSCRSRAFVPITTITSTKAILRIANDRNYHQFVTSSFRLFSTASEKSRIVFLGTPDVAASSLSRIVEKSKEDDSGYEVVGVVTQPPKRRRRKSAPEPSPVGKVAESLGIPTLCPESAKDPEFLTSLEEELCPDLCITAAYGQYLPKRFLAAPKRGTLNIHPSLLPRWRGASPVQRSLEAGDDPIGVTVLFTVSKMDAGPIVKQTTVSPVDEDAQATEILPYLFKIGTEDLLDVLPDVLDGKITMDNAQKQDEEGVIAASMIAKEEGELKVWQDSARACHNKVRGFSMWPGTTIGLKIEDSDEVSVLKVLKTRVPKLDGPQELTNNIQLGPKKTDGLMVVCADGSVLELLEVLPPFKKRMDARSFWNGCRGKKLEWIDMSKIPSLEAALN